jgi:putative transposase
VGPFTRPAPASDMRFSDRGIDVVATLDRIMRKLGCPNTIRLDNGPEPVNTELYI